MNDNSQYIKIENKEYNQIFAFLFGLFSIIMSIFLIIVPVSMNREFGEGVFIILLDIMELKKTELIVMYVFFAVIISILTYIMTVITIIKMIITFIKGKDTGIISQFIFSYLLFLLATFTIFNMQEAHSISAFYIILIFLINMLIIAYMVFANILTNNIKDNYIMFIFSMIRMTIILIVLFLFICPLFTPGISKYISSAEAKYYGGYIKYNSSAMHYLFRFNISISVFCKNAIIFFFLYLALISVANDAIKAPLKKNITPFDVTSIIYVVVTFIMQLYVWIVNTEFKSGFKVPFIYYENTGNLILVLTVHFFMLILIGIIIAAPIVNKKILQKKKEALKEELINEYRQK